ncbi:MAG: ABC transporter permease subunit, partial [Spirulinaceae cyanobacterium RM2_2_10]|nr:ABC transporter permease subunit [Spirulinaceae cyanobacterium RM2_2_10]
MSKLPQHSAAAGDRPPRSPLPATPATIEARLQAQLRRQNRPRQLVLRSLALAIAVAILIASWRTAEIEPGELWQGLPRLAAWTTRIWPPDFSELPSFLWATWETLAIAIIGTGLAMLVASPLAILVARNTTPWPWLATPLRILLNLLRGIDTAIFALFFVAVVGLGPFAGVLGVAFHTTGSMAKLYAELIETLPAEPIVAIEATGSDRWRTFAFAVWPEALPGLI